MTQFRVHPRIGFHVIDLDITMLTSLAPSSIDDQLVFFWQHCCSVSTTRQRRSPTYFLQFSPFTGITVKDIQVIERSPLVATTTMSTEHIHFACMEVTGVVGSRFRCSYFAFCVLRFTATLLVRRFLPLELRQFEDVDIIESEVASVVSSKDKQFVLADSTGSVVGSSQRSFSLASLCPPLYTRLSHFDCVHFIIRTQFPVLPMARIQSTEHHMHFSHSRNRMSRSRCRLVSCLFQGLVICWFRHI